MSTRGGIEFRAMPCREQYQFLCLLDVGHSIEIHSGASMVSAGSRRELLMPLATSAATPSITASPSAMPTTSASPSSMPSPMPTTSPSATPAATPSPSPAPQPTCEYGPWEPATRCSVGCGGGTQELERDVTVGNITLCTNTRMNSTCNNFPCSDSVAVSGQVGVGFDSPAQARLVGTMTVQNAVQKAVKTALGSLRLRDFRVVMTNTTLAGSMFEVRFVVFASRQSPGPGRRLQQVDVQALIIETLKTPSTTSTVRTEVISEVSAATGVIPTVTPPSDYPIQPVTPPPNNDDDGNKHRGLIIGLVVGSVALVVIAIIAVVVMRKNSAARQSPAQRQPSMAPYVQKGVEMRNNSTLNPIRDVNNADMPAASAYGATPQNWQ